MRRHIFNALQEWKQSESRKPLILQGARQVGKTFVLREFAASAFAQCLYVNFEEDALAHTFFEKDLDPIRIVEALSLRMGVDFNPDNTLIFFDEIQLCPNALNSLKYFCEKTPNYYVAAAGSLLGIKLSECKGFPVGKVNFLSLYPMTFFEFLEALGKQKWAAYLQSLSTFSPLNEAMHQELCELFKVYLLVGGMPEAVKTYCKTKDVIKTRIAQNEILKAYLLDFSKHAPPHQVMKITLIWNSLAKQLAKETKKFVYSVMKSGARSRDYELALQWLLDAGLVHQSLQVATPKLPLKAYADDQTFKLYCMDVGLLCALAELDPKVILEKNALFMEFKGALTENAAAQLFKTCGYSLYYWTSGNTAEVDFIVSVDGGIQPVEVKAGVSTHKKSLLVYDERYAPVVINRINLLNLNKNGKVCNYPLYLLERFPIDD